MMFLVAPREMIRRITTDNASQYKCDAVRTFCLDNKIGHRFSAPYAQYQVGKAEHPASYLWALREPIP